MCVCVCVCVCVRVREREGEGGREEARDPESPDVDIQLWHTNFQVLSP